MVVGNTTRSLAAIAIAMLAGCSGGSQIAPATTGQLQSLHQKAAQHPSYMQAWSPLASLIPPALRPENQMPLIRGVVTRGGPQIVKNKGTYVGEFFGSSILGYAPTPANRANQPPVCTDGGASSVNGMTTDTAGNLIVPNGGTHSVFVNEISNFNQATCSETVASFADPYGQPSDAAVNGGALFHTIYVGNIFDNSGNPGSVSVCTIGGCTANLTNANILELAGVAEDASGNVYASAFDGSSHARLVEFAHGAGGGTLLGGYVNSSYGGLFFDGAGNLGAIDAFKPALYVYSGCPSACHAHGPFPLFGGAIFGHLDATGKYFLAADYPNGQIDVYLYRGTQGIAYVYSFNNGLTVSDDVEAVANDPY